MKADKDWKPSVGAEIIKAVRQGKNFLQIAKESATLDYLDMTRWLKNRQNMLGSGKSRMAFWDAYESAQEDRAMLFDDQVLEAYREARKKKNMTAIELKTIQLEADMMRKVSAEYKSTKPRRQDAGPTVIIRKFVSKPAAADRK